jgi:hypothetical protein
MIVITGGQSFADVGALLTIGGAGYGPAIAVQNNMDGQDITGKKFYLTIPDEWMADPANAGKTITLPAAAASSGIPWYVWAGIGLAAVAALG